MLAEELKAAFEAQGYPFLHENHAGEAAGIQRTVEAGVHVRYLYLITRKITQQG